MNIRESLPIARVLAVSGILFCATLFTSELAAAQGENKELPRLEWTDCPFDTSDLDEERIRCGYLTVLEDRSRPKGRTIRLALAMAEAMRPNANRDAILYLPGGPGNSDLGPGLMGPGAELFATNRDFIAVDLRGSGYSEPALCPELAGTVDSIGALDLSLQNARHRYREAVAVCREELLKAGIDLGSYNATAMAADIEDLRWALGYEQWNLFGVSHGTVIAQAVMREYPGSVRSAVLNAPSPIAVDTEAEKIPHFARALNLLFEICATDETCQAQFPNLEDKIYKTYEALQEAPITVAVDSAMFSPPTFTINAADFVTMIRSMLYRDAMLPYIPLFVRSIMDRDVQVVQSFVERMYGNSTTMSAGLYYATTCHDKYTSRSTEAWDKAAAEFPALLRTLIHHQGEACDDFHKHRATEREREPVKNDTPTLIRSGQLDPVTPPEYGDEILQTLLNGHHIVFPDASHNINSQRVFCLVQLMQQFWAQPEQRPEHACVEETEGLTFATELPK